MLYRESGPVTTDDFEALVHENKKPLESTLGELLMGSNLEDIVISGWNEAGQIIPILGGRGYGGIAALPRTLLRSDFKPLPEYQGCQIYAGSGGGSEAVDPTSFGQPGSIISAPVLNDRGSDIGMLITIFDAESTGVESLCRELTAISYLIGALIEKSFFAKAATSQLNLLREVEEVSKVGAWEYLPETDELYWSKETYRIHGLADDRPTSLGEAIGFYSEENQQSIRNHLAEALNLGTPYCEEFRISDNLGQEKYIRTSGRAEKNREGEIIRLYGAIEDVSDEHSKLSEVQAQKSRLVTILDNLNDAVVTIDRRGIITSVNQPALRIFGYEQRELIGQSVNMLMPDPYASQHDTYISNYLETGQAKIIGVGRQLPAKRRNGEIFQMELTLSEVQSSNEMEFVGIVRDISERIAAEDTIYNLAYSDPVTGLRNLRWFEKEFKTRLQPAKHHEPGGHLFAAMIDIDRMGQFNVSYGFEAGNELLEKLGRALASQIGNDWTLYKSGADSFLVVSTDSELTADAVLLSKERIENRIRSEANGTFVINGFPVPVSVSVGTVMLKSRRCTYEQLIDTLEFALGEAKRNAPNGFFLADEEVLRQYERGQRIRTLVHGLADSGELKVVLQPQYKSRTEIVSAEVLIRWFSKELGFVGPDEFIPIAEETNAIQEIGRWVVNRACQLLHEVGEKGLKTSLAVNISAKQIVASKFKEDLLNSLREWNVGPEQLILELTETTLVSDIKLVKSVMQDLSQLGFRFSIDDFGTGYSSLGYLKELPINELKIDKYFIDAIGDEKDRQGQKIVDMIISMAQVLGVQSVAEGVEHEHQMTYLQGRNCNMFQGYFFSRPLLPEAWKEKMGV